VLSPQPAERVEAILQGFAPRAKAD
jgi:hypothetical protein